MTEPSTVKLRGRDKLARIPIKVIERDPEPKPPWLKMKVSLTDLKKVSQLKQNFRDRKLVTVCEEANCPNLIECFSQHGTATFMILGDICTRRCTFCDVAHGKPKPVDPEEPQNLADTVRLMNLDYVVITSVDRDDLKDGGAEHFTACISLLRQTLPNIKIEILVPDFRGRWPRALDILSLAPPDVFNHNIETTPRLYKAVRPGSDYQHSLNLLKSFKAQHPTIPTKSGFMVGLGESDEEIEMLLHDLYKHNVDRVTIGQYLSPSSHHTPVDRYVHPDTFDQYRKLGYSIGFRNIQSGPMVRSSYHAKNDHSIQGKEL